MLIEFTLPIPGAPKERPRLGRGGVVFTPSKTKHFEAKVHKIALAAMRQRGFSTIAVGRSVVVSLLFFFEPPKSWSRARLTDLAKRAAIPRITTPDLDNLEKAVLDGMKGAVYADDKQVFELSSLKAWSCRFGDCVNVAVSTLD